MLIFKRVYKKKRKKKRLTKEQKTESLLRRKWGMDLKKLNGYICCISGITDRKKLISHHLNSYHTHPEERYNLDNGVVIDKTLHKKFHKIYGYKSTTKEQFSEFMLKEKVIMATKEKSKPTPKKPVTKKEMPIKKGMKKDC